MKVLLVDDHPLILAALQTIIRGLGDDMHVVTAATAREAREILAADPEHDLVLLDLQLGDADGFEVLGELREVYPALPVVVVSASDRASDVIRSIDMGAMGFVPKRATNETLFEALRLVMSGGIYVPPMTLGSEPRGELSSGGDTVPDVMRHVDGNYQRTPTLEALGLTARQHDVLLLLLQGKPNKHIARELNLSVETIKDHVAAVLRALGVSSRTQAVLAVSQMMQQQPGTKAAWKPSER
jgi:DNA-binding NarL/FixJ family response regulator